MLLKMMMIDEGGRQRGVLLLCLTLYFAAFALVIGVIRILSKKLEF